MKNCIGMLAAALSVTVAAGSAQAAVYKYDLALELTKAELFPTEGSSGEMPSDILIGTQCSQDQYGYRCSGRPNDPDQLREAGVLQYFPEYLSATLFLDTEYETFGPGLKPRCFGSSFYCSIVSDPLYFVGATKNTFAIQAGSGSEDIFISQDGISYENDSLYFFDFGGVSYFTFNGIVVEYTTTRFNVSEVPLPASLPLLGLAVAAAGIAARRKRSNA